MTSNIIQLEDKIKLIMDKSDKKMKRKILAISPSQYLMMEKSKRLSGLLEKKLNEMKEEKIDVLFQELK